MSELCSGPGRNGGGSAERGKLRGGGSGAGGKRRAQLSRCLGTFGDAGSRFARSAWLWHPRIPAGGMGLGGCCGIRRAIPAGPSSLLVPLAPAQPPARAELCRSWRDGSRRLRAVVSRGRPGHTGARSAPPCSAPASSTRPWWRARAASWATRTVRGARRASRPAPPGPLAVPGSRGQVGAMGLPGEGLRRGPGWVPFGGVAPGKFAASALPTPAWGWAGPEPLWLEASLSPALPVLGGGGRAGSGPLTPGAGAGEEPLAAHRGCADMPGTSHRLAGAIRTEIIR